MFRPAAYFAATIWSILLLSSPEIRAEDSQLFGKKDSGGAALIGTLYDFKQTQKRQPTGASVRDYGGIIEEFLNKDWSESVLNRYFRATRALYTTQIFIPLMSADQAPKAFEMQNIIKPSLWVIFYKGQVSPPEDGTYRFIGYADDLLAVAVNGKTACIGARFRLDSWKPSTSGPRIPAANGDLTYGDWIPMKKDVPIDLDILVGERPGGQFCAFLLFEKQGAEYPVGDKGLPMYPIFQTAPFNTPNYAERLAPPVSPSSQFWKGYQ